MPLLVPQTDEILELDIPQHADILSAQQGLYGHDRRETNVVRWSTVNCSATEFQRSGNRLRSSLYREPRTTKLLISVHIDATHNEDDVRMAISTAMLNVHGVNDKKIPGLSLSWKDVVVLLVGSVDNMKPEVVGLLQRLGIYRAEELNSIDKGSVGQTFEYTTLLSPYGVSDKPSPSASPCQLALYTSHTPLTAEEAHKWTIYAIADTLQADIWIPLPVGQTVGTPETAFSQAINEFHSNERYLSMTIKDYSSGSLATAQILSPFASRENIEHVDRKGVVLQEALQARDKVRAYRLSLESLPVVLTFE
ncbi:hypothetical protein VHEMI09175 [[Torrubiella] hemipterigena]|uniref:Chitin synthase n=1 Tax=[Torrubiella] hemipterigena TaxID=1531966 RepID=A0A0A1TR19_9HYPO|nr:hypothetical protein VHEMI09175 [[Torrubiella] hemipterigena]